MNTMSETPFVRRVGRYALWLFLAAVIAVPAEAARQQEEEKPVPENKITALELHAAFKKDKEAAVKLYSNKIFEISGIAVYVGPDVYALPSVELSGKKGEKGKVLCVLPFSDYFKLRKVSKGNKMVMKGEIRGYNEKLDIVVVKECEIVENKEE